MLYHVSLSLLPATIISPYYYSLRLFTTTIPYCRSQLPYYLIAFGYKCALTLQPTSAPDHYSSSISASRAASYERDMESKRGVRCSSSGQFPGQSPGVPHMQSGTWPM